MTNQTQTLEQRSVLDSSEVWAREKVRTRVYPEACPNKDIDVNFDTAKYVINGKVFDYAPLACGCHANIQRKENGVIYNCQPGTEGLLSVVYDTLVGTINELNNKKRLIRRVEIVNEGNIFSGDAAVNPETGRVILSKRPFENISDEAKKENLNSSLYHEGAHVSYYHFNKSNKKYFEHLFKSSITSGVVNWFKEGDYVNKEDSTNILQEAGHPKDAPTELYASASLVSKIYKSKFNERYYNNANPEQKKIVDEIFKFIETPKKSFINKIFTALKNVA